MKTNNQMKIIQQYQHFKRILIKFNNNTQIELFKICICRQTTRRQSQTTERAILLSKNSL